MIVSSIIHWVEQFLLVGLVSLAIVIATIRAYFTMILLALRASGLSPLFIFCLLGVVSIYGAAIIRYCACRNVSADEEYGMVDLEVLEGRILVSNSLIRHRQVRQDSEVDRRIFVVIV